MCRNCRNRGRRCPPSECEARYYCGPIHYTSGSICDFGGPGGYCDIYGPPPAYYCIPYRTAGPGLSPYAWSPDGVPRWRYS